MLFRNAMGTRERQKISFWSSQMVWCRRLRKLQKNPNELVRQCQENEVRRMLDVDIPGKRRRGRPNLRWKDACKRYDRGQCNKQGRMEGEANQLYRRPQMTGQARDEEEGWQVQEEGARQHDCWWSCASWNVLPPSEW